MITNKIIAVLLIWLAIKMFKNGQKTEKYENDPISLVRFNLIGIGCLILAVTFFFLKETLCDYFNVESKIFCF